MCKPKYLYIDKGEEERRGEERRGEEMREEGMKIDDIDKERKFLLCLSFDHLRYGLS